MGGCRIEGLLHLSTACLEATFKKKKILSNDVIRHLLIICPVLLVRTVRASSTISSSIDGEYVVICRVVFFLTGRLLSLLTSFGAPFRQCFVTGNFSRSIDAWAIYLYNQLIKTNSWY